MALFMQLKLGVTPSHTTIYAACCLVYLGLLCSSKFTLEKGGRYLASLNLSRGSVKFFSSLKSTTHTWLMLSASKTNPFWPIAALRKLYVELPCSNSAPLFEQPDGNTLTYVHFVSEICNTLSLVGLNPGLHARHNFCHGTTSAAAVVGYSDYEIQLLGRWQSDFYKLFIENDLNQILHLSSLLHLAYPYLVPFEPLTLYNYTAVAWVFSPFLLRRGNQHSRTISGPKKLNFFPASCM